MNFKTGEFGNEGEQFLKTLLTFSRLKLAKSKNFTRKVRASWTLNLECLVVWLKLCAEYYKTKYKSTIQQKPYNNKWNREKLLILLEKSTFSSPRPKRKKDKKKHILPLNSTDNAALTSNLIKVNGNYFQSTPLH